MTHPILSRIPFLGKFVDERFLEHRRRSSSIAGFATLILALCIFEYQLIFNHVISWDMAAIMLTFAVVKMSMFTWYRLNA
ncbi:MAG: hypothetical protein ABSG32_30680 [Terriglobia bacterium]|jgi:hypothetical protein